MLLMWAATQKKKIEKEKKKNRAAEGAAEKNQRNRREEKEREREKGQGFGACARRLGGEMSVSAQIQRGESLWRALPIYQT